jgi:hypothetical protein
LNLFLTEVGTDSGAIVWAHMVVAASSKNTKALHDVRIRIGLDLIDLATSYSNILPNIFEMVT